MWLTSKETEDPVATERRCVKDMYEMNWMQIMPTERPWGKFEVRGGVRFQSVLVNQTYLLVNSCPTCP